MIPKNDEVRGEREGNCGNKNVDHPKPGMI
jgi:hypothetical protein